MTQIYFSEARHADDILRLALGAAQLPTDDLGGPDQMFFSLSDDEGLIGFIGLEGNGPDRLLRSLVVLPTRRGKGYGRMLVERLEGVACQSASKKDPLSACKRDPFVEQRDGYDGRAVRAGCGVGRA